MFESDYVIQIKCDQLRPSTACFISSDYVPAKTREHLLATAVLRQNMRADVFQSTRGMLNKCDLDAPVRCFANIKIVT